ncbi:MAG: hypothetical protein J6T64_05055 [Bacteroidaceae bacterium]|nr:hypothetical protein [Bacteroidaceae bacterium]
MEKNHLFRLMMAALIALMGFSSCSRVFYGKREKPAPNDPSKPIEENIPDLKVVPTLPPDGHAIRVLYSVPPRSYQWGR